MKHYLYGLIKKIEQKVNHLTDNKGKNIDSVSKNGRK